MPASAAGAFSKATPSTSSLAIKNGGGEQIVETTQLATGQWVHVAVTLDRSVAKLFVNGVPRATNSVTIHPSDFAPVLNYLGESQFSADRFSMAGWMSCSFTTTP